MSKYKKEEKVGSAIMRLMKAYGHEEKLKEVSILRAWEDITGPYVTKHTERLTFENGNVKIKLSSAALRNEFNMSKTKIAKALNDHLEKGWVNTVEIL
jgi:hypothetical protein